MPPKCHICGEWMNEWPHKCKGAVMDAIDRLRELVDLYHSAISSGSEIAAADEFMQAAPALLAELAAARAWRDNLMNEWSRARSEGPYSNYTDAYDAARRATDAAMEGK